jgi:hypothetical protein
MNTKQNLDPRDVVWAAERALERGRERRCPVHGERLSSPCGQFDAICSKCDSADYEAEAALEDERIRTGELAP